MDVTAYLLERRVEPLVDLANQDMRNARVRVRHELLPRLEEDRPGIVVRLHNVAARAAAWQHALEEAAARRLPQEATQRAEVELSAFAAAAPAEQAEVLRQLYWRAGGSQPGLSAAQLRLMRWLAAVGRPRELDLPGRISFRVRYGCVVMVKKVATSQDGVSQQRLRVEPCPGDTPHPAAAHLKPAGRIRLGHRQPGLRMRPLGGSGSRKLQDILVDAKVPRWERDLLPLVFVDDRLAWVPGLAVDAELVAGPGEPCVQVSLEPYTTRANITKLSSRRLS